MIPGARGFIVYDVQSGDTLSKIARDNGYGSSTVQAIVLANQDQIHDPDHIEVGWKLRIPIS